MRWLVLTALLTALPAAAFAQDEDAGAVTVEVHTERPPAGSMRRGLVPAPGWVLYLGGGLLVVAAGGGLAWRLARARRK
ncbi:MAG: hypothetical protein H6719_00795 [Sandaracinaceae bacterium]|nr:hypothetical protein [Sandaracinaceae bacterium]